jgi:tellurite methyltransferase
MEPAPFWESAFKDLGAPSPFGPPSGEFLELLNVLPKNARVLDLACGDGRNALFLARLRIPRDGDQRSELMSITIPK